MVNYTEMLARALMMSGVERYRVWTCHCGQKIRVDVARLVADATRVRCGACKCVLPDRARDVEEFVIEGARRAWERGVGGSVPVNVPAGAGGQVN
jgi:hypothetical protein